MHNLLKWAGLFFTIQLLLVICFLSSITILQLEQAEIYKIRQVNVQIESQDPLSTKFSTTFKNLDFNIEGHSDHETDDTLDENTVLTHFTFQLLRTSSNCEYYNSVKLHNEPFIKIEVPPPKV